jgi:2-hydroxy-6-oxonona-2,4-dienedioate hydrolase
MQSRFLDVHGLRLHYRAAGDESVPPIVLVHGIGVSSRYLVPVGDALSDRFRVLAPDLPGFGRSERPRGVPGVSDLGDWLARFLDAAGLDRTHALANSMGCQIVLDLAAREPERFDRIVLVGPTVDGFARSFVRQVVRLARDSLREPPRLLEIIALDYLRFGPRRIAVTGLDALRDRIEDNAARVEAPTLVIRGERDALVSREWAKLIAERLRHGRFEPIRGHAHAVHYSAPQTVGDLATPFLLGEERE